MSDESTSGDTSAEVERPKTPEAARAMRVEAKMASGLDALRDPEEAAWLRAWRSMPAASRASAAMTIRDDAMRHAMVLYEATQRAEGFEPALPTRAVRLLATGDALVHLAALAADLAARADAEDALPPSPESVTGARLVAAEIVEVEVASTAHWDPRSARWTANQIAQAIRDRARTHSGTHDEGGDVDAATLLWCAARVDGCTTLGELEALVREWREVA